MNPLERLLCPVDLREPSRAALACAAMFAEEFASVLDAVYVPEGYDPHSNRLFAPRTHAVQKLMTAHNLKAELSSLLGTRSPAVPSTVEVRWGRVLRVILEEARQRQSNMIIVGAPDQRSSWRCTTRLADALATEAPCPVLTVPDQELSRKPSRILLAVDLSEATDYAVEWTALLASRFDASVEVVHPERGLGGSPKELQKIEGRFERAGVLATMRAARGASVLADVVGRRASGTFQLVVVGLERRGARWLDASFVERLRGRANMPVLSVVAKTERQLMPSLDPGGRLRDLFPSLLQPVAQRYVA
jgi:nucleotide-binding universal stress UspA family protein